MKNAETADELQNHQTRNARRGLSLTLNRPERLNALMMKSKRVLSAVRDVPGRASDCSYGLCFAPVRFARWRRSDRKITAGFFDEPLKVLNETIMLSVARLCLYCGAKALLPAESVCRPAISWLWLRAPGSTGVYQNRCHLLRGTLYYPDWLEEGLSCCSVVK